MKSHLPSASFQRACARLTFCATLATSLPAGASEGADVDHAKRARIGYDLQDWATAIREYRAAYEAEQKSEYLFGLAQALRQRRDYPAAIYTFKAFVRLDGVSPQQTSTAELLIVKCEAAQAAAEAQAQLRERPPVPSEAASSADPFAPSQAPPRAAAGALPLGTLPNESVAAESRSAPPSAFYEDVLGDSLFAAGLVAGGVGTGLLLGGNAAMNDAAGEPTEADARRAVDSAHQKQIVGSLLLPLGGALVAGAVWRWVRVGRDTPQEVGGVSVGPGYVGYRGRF